MQEVFRLYCPLVCTQPLRDDDPTLWLYVEYTLLGSIYLLMIYIS